MGFAIRYLTGATYLGGTERRLTIDGRRITIEVYDGCGRRFEDASFEIPPHYLEDVIAALSEGRTDAAG